MADARGHDARVLQLDVLRGVAIVLVLFRHAVDHSARWPPLEPVVRCLYRLGWTGVDLFFVLSGFLIGGLLFKEIRQTNRLDVPRFLVRRALKIWPAYFLLLLVVFLKGIRHVGWARSFHAILPGLLHVQNYFGSPRGMTWSLAVEEHFYLVLPILLALCCRRGKVRVGRIPFVPIFAIALATICLNLRLAVAPTPYRADDQAWFLLHAARTHLRIDSLFFGLLLAYFFHFHPAGLSRIARHRAALMVAGVALVAPAGAMDVGNRFMHTAGFTMLYLGYSSILLATLYTTPGVGLAGRCIGSTPARALAIIGTYSYAMYLWAEDLGERPMAIFVAPHAAWIPAPLHWLALMGMQILITFVAGLVMTKLVERPALALRDRLYPPRASSPATRVESHAVAVAAPLSAAAADAAQATLVATRPHLP